MAHYAKISDGQVVDVQVIVNGAFDNPETWLTETFGGTWMQTSYNTRGGVHYTEGQPSSDQTKALRFNYAGVGFTYDADRDAFIPPKPFDSWVLDEATCLWVAPIDYPADGGEYVWDEATTDWVEVV